MKQLDVPLWRKSMLQHLNLDDILKILYEIAENGDPFGYESSESGYYQDYKEQFDELAIGAGSLLDALTEYDLREHWDDMTVCLLGQTTTVLGYDSVEMDYYHMADPFCEELAVQEAQKRLSRLTKADLIRTFRTVMVVLTSFFDIKAAHDCLTSIVQELDERAAIMDRRLKVAFAAKDEAEAKKVVEYAPGQGLGGIGGCQMSFQLPNTRQVSSSEQVRFHCKHCGACCRHLQESVPLNTLDAYRLAKYLRGRGQSVTCLDEIFARYAEPVPLDKSGYTVYMLKTDGTDDACIFLKDNRCTIQQAKPTACRLYPFVAEPTTDGGCKFLLSMERRHHFKGGQVQAGRWMKKYFSPEDREFMQIDMGSAPVIALLMRKVPASEQKRAIMQYLWYRFSDFDLERPLVEQYRQNTIKLVTALKNMNEEAQNGH